MILLLTASVVFVTTPELDSAIEPVPESPAQAESVDIPVPPPPAIADLGAIDLRKASRSGDSWDIQAELGVRLLPNRMRCVRRDCVDRDQTTRRQGVPWKAFDWDKMDPALPLFGRLQLGYLWLREPFLVTVGATASYGGLGGFGIGVITEVSHIWAGLWMQFEPAWVFGRGLNFSIATGYTLIGVEWKFTPAEFDNAVLVKARIPIGLIRFVKSNF